MSTHSKLEPTGYLSQPTSVLKQVDSCVDLCTASKPIPERTFRNTIKDSKAPRRVKWYHASSPALMKKLRAIYGNGIERYLRAYQLTEDGFSHSQETGMQLFVKFEKRLMRKARMRSYYANGMAQLDHFGSSLAGYRSSTAPKDVTFVSIDFEGTMHGNGITEFGLAKLNIELGLSNMGSMTIETRNWAMSNRALHRPPFAFGTTIVTPRELLPSTIVDDFDSLKNVVLVCHGLHNEIQNLEDLGVPIQDLPVTGVIDTFTLA